MTTIQRTSAHAARIFAAIALAAASACAGHGAGSLPNVPTAGNGAGTTSSARGDARFTITVPRETTASTARRPQYVSPATASLRIAVTAVNGQASTFADTVAQIAYGAPGCTADKTQPLSCAIEAPAPVGSVTYAISTYATSDATGAVLSRATIVAQVTADKVNVVPVSLGGVPATVALSPSSLPLVVDGAIHRFTVVANALDASGATIVGTTPYASPVSLSVQNDPAHAISLSASTITQPGTPVTVTYDASKAVQGPTIAAATGAASVGAVRLMVVSPQALMLNVNGNGSPVNVSEAGFTGTFTAQIADANAASASVLPGPSGAQSAVVLVKPLGAFDTTQLAISDGTATATVPLTVAPTLGTYAEYGQNHQLRFPTNFLYGPGSAFWIADADARAIVSFDPATDAYTSFPVTGGGPSGLALGSDGRLWFGDGSAVAAMDPTTHLITTYATGLSASSNVQSVVAGPSGKVWFFDSGTSPTSFGSIDEQTGAIVEYPSDGATATGPAFLGTMPMSMVEGPDGNVWFADGNGFIGKIDVSSGAISEIDLHTPAYPTISAVGLCVGSDKRLWFTTSTESLAMPPEIGAIDPTTGAISWYTENLTPTSLLYAIAPGPHGYLWFLDRAAGTFGSSDYTSLGVLNPATGATYIYPQFVPDFTQFDALLNRGDGNLWLLDNSWGKIGEVPVQ